MLVGCSSYSRVRTKYHTHIRTTHTYTIQTHTYPNSKYTDHIIPSRCTTLGRYLVATSTWSWTMSLWVLSVSILCVLAGGSHCYCMALVLGWLQLQHHLYELVHRLLTVTLKQSATCSIAIGSVLLRMCSCRAPLGACGAKVRGCPGQKELARNQPTEICVCMRLLCSLSAKVQ